MKYLLHIWVLQCVLYILQWSLMPAHARNILLSSAGMISMNYFRPFGICASNRLKQLCLLANIQWRNMQRHRTQLFPLPSYWSLFLISFGDHLNFVPMTMQHFWTIWGNTNSKYSSNKMPSLVWMDPFPPLFLLNIRLIPISRTIKFPLA